ncbi:MAG TPA: 3-hydroxyacyl-CoA dehydrogenase NAD-binding domain-containing protein [Polyangiaceae bacterium]|jgi:3-hydroxyacyl-CoA dehydrogenase|nr:3-hydroxyacyl-CoA dehydrogenase NAD-binding domain-containing protein [Polyangiaceae bacterium]
MAGVVAFERRNSVGIITVDSPPVNALSQAVRAGLADALREALSDSAVESIVLRCKGRTFIAGADITEFGKPPREPSLQSVIESYDQSTKPIVAAIHGTALGGGLEVALGCNYRVASTDAKVGLPEVKLGILPGAGGTQRLPRLVGVEKALEIIVGGDPVSAKEAKAIGLVDELVEGDLLEGAVAFATGIAAKRPLPRVRDLTANLDPAKLRPGLFDDAKKDAKKKSRGAVGPARCVDAVRAAVEMPFEQGLAEERRLITEAIASVESRAMRHVFFAERKAAKIPDVGSDVKTLPLKKAAVIGAGTMGAGIAMVFANAGIPVVLVDREQSFVDKGLDIIKKNYGATLKKGKLSQSEMDARVGRISGTTNWDEMVNVDLVIEAVFEEMGLKREIFGRLDKLCKKETILASNTSTLDVDQIAAATSRPEQVIGLHFFSPANVMRLLEIVRGKKTSKEVVATSMKLAKDIGKVGVLVGVCQGFVGNRMLHQYYREAQFLIQEGALPSQVDKVMTGFGFAMGPCATSDLAGIDVGWRIRKAQPKPPPGERYSGAVADRLAEMGRFGQKTSAGFYRYEAGNRTPIDDPEVEKIIVEVSKELGIERRQVEDAEILERNMYALINEGAKILDEKIALRASDIDTVWINGYGFPAHRGGPMFYADTVGLPKVLERVKALQEKHGKVWTPSKLLEKLAGEGRTFADFDAEKDAS